MNQSLNTASMWSNVGVQSSDNRKIPISSSKTPVSTISAATTPSVITSSIPTPVAVSDLCINDNNNTTSTTTNDFIHINAGKHHVHMYDNNLLNGSAFDEPAEVAMTTQYSQYSGKLMSGNKMRDYKGFGDIDPGSFVDGAFIPNQSHTNSGATLDNSESSILMKLFQQQQNQQQHQMNMLPPALMMRPEDEYLWFYLDPRNNVQGPFPDKQMFQWWSHGIYFQNSLLMKRKCDADFSTLQDYSKRFGGVPFNRDDMRVPPLSESLTHPIQSSISQVIHQSDPIATASGTTTSNTAANSNDPGMIMKLLAQNSASPNDISRIFQKFNMHDADDPISNSTVATSTPSAITCNANSFPSLANGCLDQPNHSSVSINQSLSNFVSVQQQNSQPLQSQSKAASHDFIALTSYMSADRYSTTNCISDTWNPPNQSVLSDNVWTTNRDSNAMGTWSTAGTDLGGDGNSVSIVDASPVSPSRPQTNGDGSSTSCSTSGGVTESWEKIDPAIIKMGRPDAGTSSSVAAAAPLIQQQHAWAELVRGKTHRSSGGHVELQGVSKSGVNKTTSATGGSISAVNTGLAVGPIGSGVPGNAGARQQQPQQHFTEPSLTSDSSEEIERQRSESCDKELDCLIEWSKLYLENKPAFREVDIATLVELLIAVESPFEVEAMLTENVPDFESASEFVHIFLEKRRPLRQRMMAAAVADPVPQGRKKSALTSAPVVGPEQQQQSCHEPGTVSGCLDCGMMPLHDQHSPQQPCPTSKWQVSKRHQTSGNGASRRRKNGARQQHAISNNTRKSAATEY